MRHSKPIQIGQTSTITWMKCSKLALGLSKSIQILITPSSAPVKTKPRVEDIAWGRWARVLGYIKQTTRRPLKLGNFMSFQEASSFFIWYLSGKSSKICILKI